MAGPSSAGMRRRDRDKKFPNKSEKTTTATMNPFKLSRRCSSWCFGRMSLLGGLSAVVGVIVAVILFKASPSFVQRFWELRALTSPLDAPRAVQELLPGDAGRRLWGSYRSGGLYFGLRTRSPKDLLTGLMWYLPEKVSHNSLGLRHWCEQSDDLDKYGWMQHDGVTFGRQEIFDRGLHLTTSFVKPEQATTGKEGSAPSSSGSWTARIAVDSYKPKKKLLDKKPNVASLFFYAAIEGSGSLDAEFEDDDGSPRRLTKIQGRTTALNDFVVSFKVDRENRRKILDAHAAGIDSNGPEEYTNDVMRNLMVADPRFNSPADQSSSSASYPKIGLKPTMSRDANFVVTQLVVELPFHFDVVFHPLGSEDTFHGQVYSEALESKLVEFDDRFEKTFHLKEKGYNSSMVGFAQAALSNMVGGISYFYGHSLVRSDATNATQYWDAPLYTAVPSRSFFPRGFLWDEGFHNLLISKWSKEISSDILAHWFDLMNSEGWIPREQILGNEARAKVPAEFVVQNNKFANPPTLLLTLHSMVQDAVATDSIQPWFRSYLARLWPRLEAWYNWFDQTQFGKVPGTYRWRGRDSTTDRELNPKTLTSGLDDFPRASHPTDDERHVDLRCWMALGSRLMSNIATIIGLTEESARFGKTADFLSDNRLLNEQHWSEEHGSYLDFGLHSEDVVLRKSRHHHQQHEDPEAARVILTEPKLQLVNQFGYVGLFPFILGVMDVDSPKMSAVLDSMEDGGGIYSDFGLRSLSKKASLYKKRNTEHDPPYWRGQVWININYLAVKQLFKVAKSAKDAHVSRKAERIYEKLRKGLIDNIYREYVRTGFLWEQYDDVTGKGMGCRPFTGWTSLVVLMMSETY